MLKKLFENFKNKKSPDNENSVLKIQRFDIQEGEKETIYVEGPATVLVYKES